MLFFITGLLFGAFLTMIIVGYMWETEIEKRERENTNEKKD
jgi:predicted membrane protein